MHVFFEQIKRLITRLKPANLERFDIFKNNFEKFIRFLMNFERRKRFYDVRDHFFDDPETICSVFEKKFWRSKCDIFSLKTDFSTVLKWYVHFLKILFRRSKNDIFSLKPIFRRSWSDIFTFWKFYFGGRKMIFSVGKPYYLTIMKRYVTFWKKIFGGWKMIFSVGKPYFSTIMKRYVPLIRILFRRSKCDIFCRIGFFDDHKTICSIRKNTISTVENYF